MVHRETRGRVLLITFHQTRDLGYPHQVEKIAIDDILSAKKRHHHHNSVFCSFSKTIIDYELATLLSQSINALRSYVGEEIGANESLSELTLVSYNK